MKLSKMALDTLQNDIKRNDNERCDTKQNDGQHNATKCFDSQSNSIMTLNKMTLTLSE
jgi:hypothetical protein